MATFHPTKLAKKGEAKLDLAFVIDCTSSMDPYITEARDNIVQIVNEIVESENCDVHLALIEYRDHPPVEESFVTQVHDFTESVGTMKKWLRDCYAGGGGDIPEAVADAMNDLLKLSWREEATKICVFITDAPPHGLGAFRDKFPEGCPLGLDPMEIARALAAKGIGIYVAGCEPSIKAYKDFYLAVAHITGGQYIPLEEANCLVKIIIYGAKEEMSLKKFEEEVDKEIVELKTSKRIINEDEVTNLLHTRWQQRGETTKQLTLNQRGLATAKSSATAMDITTMRFDAVKTLYKTTTHKMRQAKVSDESQNKDETAQVEECNLKSKITMATESLAKLQTDTPTAPRKVDLSSVLGTIDFGPAPVDENKLKDTNKHETAQVEESKITMATESLANLQTEPPTAQRKVDLSSVLGTIDFGPAPVNQNKLKDTNDVNMKSKKGGYQCIDGGVTLNQTMRLVQKSMIKMMTKDSEKQ
ncbi:uncharacterized protein LOC132748484 [Ruditapes philippinarum]|uniref:uncharacterized protein LOC132748484 n=1 Tax=Ruditapes philippinarum TaxID=129788 RepID=UPI00295A6BBF|nr:uncharacterized protein LOC132748484 [Ruditapes philippinarum]